MNHNLWVTIYTALLCALISQSAVAESLLVEEGHALAEANCARCHNLENTGDSPFAPAPPFRVLSKIYNPADLEKAFAQGLVVEHPAMPEFKMTPRQAAALAEFIGSLGH